VSGTVCCGFVGEDVSCVLDNFVWVYGSERLLSVWEFSLGF